MTDCSSFAAAKDDFLRLYPEETARLSGMKDVRAAEDNLATHLRVMKRPPNNRQFALATTAAILLKHHKKQLYVVKGGDGKSRIAISLAILHLKTAQGGRGKKN